MKEKTSLQKALEIILPLLIFYVVCDIARSILQLLLEVSFTYFGESYQIFISNQAKTVYGMISGIAMLIGLWAISKTAKQEIKITSSTQKTDIVGQVTEYGFLCGLAFTSAIGINVLLALTGLIERSETYVKVAEHQYGISFWIGIVIFGMISPLAEEVVFRGIIYNRMKKYYTLPSAIAVSSLLFGIYHGNIVQGIYGTIMGLLIAFVYYKYDTFVAPLLFHMVVNISTYTMMYDSNSFETLVHPITGVIFVASAVGFFLYIWFSFKKEKDDFLKKP